ncbi:DM DNA-binding domain [Cinara cedri]|uniref:DM DNA-binding domain n=1 Tax=Cinara cedri TaxID=506608 RepID=A0A5E4MX97_9HEMI|nr:DM DNA-binding domain [Cinara cedri]
MPSGKHQHHHHQQQQVTSATAVAAVVAAQTIKEKQRLCTNCKNHNLRKVWKKHKRYCKYRDCTCPKCTKTAATRKNCAEQTAKRRARQEDEQREQELQLNPANFLDERPIPYTGTVFGVGVDTAASVSTFRSIGQMSSSSLAAASSTTKASSSRTSEYDDNSFIEVDVPPTDQSIVSDARGGRLENTDEDIDAGKQQRVQRYRRRARTRRSTFPRRLKKNNNNNNRKEREREREREKTTNKSVSRDAGRDHFRRARFGEAFYAKKFAARIVRRFGRGTARTRFVYRNRR